MSLREKLIVLRDKAGITQMALAHQLGVSRQAVTRWESGDTAPSMDKLKALAKIYDVSLDWLCSEADEPYENKEKSESIRLDEDEQKAEPYDMRNKRTSVKRTVIVCAVVLAALIFACVVFVKARQKAKSIDELPYKTIEPNDSSDEPFGFEW
jgi:transcriptional regulator with XRE-family HTH domain